MSNVIPISKNDAGYDMGDNGETLASSRKHDIQIGFDLNGPVIRCNGEALLFDRDELARFLWMSAYLVDSEERWVENEYVGVNYDGDSK